MKNKIYRILIVVIIFFIATPLALSQIDQDVKDDLYSQIELYSYTLTTIQADYVEEMKPKDLIYGSLKGMLQTLDPHSQFLPPDEYKELKTETQGKFGGLGIEISIRDGLLTIITPIDGTPAWRAGIKAGDRIVKIEDELTKDITLSDAVKQLRGDPGTDIHITVLRESEFKILEFTITREVIHIQDVKHPHILVENIGYVRLAEFREDSSQEIKKALQGLADQGATSLILDLRNNPGGLLNVAISITEQFLPDGQTIVSTKGRRFSQNSITKANNNNDYIKWPIVILINEGSASGSEILAGALKDNKRAIIVGTQSFGKGSVQSVIPLPDGSGLRLTTSKYFTPSGESIHGKGITPDIVIDYVPIPEEEKDEKEDTLDKIFKKVEKHDSGDDSEDTEEVVKEDTGDEKEAEAHERLLKDNQVQSAINVLQGIQVYNSF